jgi:hypothetical protein
MAAGSAAGCSDVAVNYLIAGRNKLIMSSGDEFWDLGMDISRIIFIILYLIYENVRAHLRNQTKPYQESRKVKIHLPSCRTTIMIIDERITIRLQ